MIEVVTRHNAFMYPDALESMFRMRHRVFVERMGWEDLRKPDGLETDQFDNGDAVYLLMLDDGGDLIGSHRLLPTLKPHLFSHVFPEFCDVAGLQRGSKIYELTRSCVDEDRLTKDQIRKARKRLMTGLMEFCVKAGIEQFTVLGRIEIISVYVRLGWKIRPLGIPKPCDGLMHVGAVVDTTPEALAAVRHAYRIDEELVSSLDALHPVSTPSVPGGHDMPGLIH